MRSPVKAWLEDARRAPDTRHVDTCDANTGPIFLAYREKAEINAVLDKYTALAPEYDFISDGITLINIPKSGCVKLKRGKI